MRALLDCTNSVDPVAYLNRVGSGRDLRGRAGGRLSCLLKRTCIGLLPGEVGRFAPQALRAAQAEGRGGIRGRSLQADRHFRPPLIMQRRIAMKTWLVASLTATILILPMSQVPVQAQRDDAQMHMQQMQDRLKTMQEQMDRMQ